MKIPRDRGRYFSVSSPVSLEDALRFRERRNEKQKELLARYKTALLCYSLNIPGAYKAFPLALRCFHEEERALEAALAALGMEVRLRETVISDHGYTGYIAADAAPEKLKALGVELEESHALGRLFDIDVLNPEGEKLSRGTGRSCLVCGADVFACSRNRAHGLDAVLDKVLELMENFLRKRLGDLVSSAAVRALMGEAAVSPKPGLVDRFNQGAHRDMDFFTFIDSASALVPFFREWALEGFDWEGRPEDLFTRLRFRGRMAESAMLRATGGVNTHKGLIFSIGLLSAAYGCLFRESDQPEADEIFRLAALMARGTEDDFSSFDRGTSHGEKVYAQCGLRGARGEAARGFAGVRDLALPLLDSLLGGGLSMNDAGALVLLHLLAYTEDTNIAYRSGAGTLECIRNEMRSFLNTKPDIQTLLEKAGELDREFTAKNISPGGSADLLGITLFLNALGL